MGCSGGSPEEPKVSPVTLNLKLVNGHTHPRNHHPDLKFESRKTGGLGPRKTRRDNGWRTSSVHNDTSHPPSDTTSRGKISTCIREEQWTINLSTWNSLVLYYGLKMGPLTFD